MRGAVAGLILLLSAPSGSRGDDFSYRFSLWNELQATRSRSDSPFNPGGRVLRLPSWSDTAVAVGEASYRLSPGMKVAGGFLNRFDHALRTTDRLRLKELYLTWSVDPHWDVTVGKKILKWGVGYAWTPTGVLDPPRDPRDPSDRLSQYQGRELVEARGTFGRHSVTAAFAPRDRLWAAKYDGLVRGLDFSLVASRGRDSPTRIGASASYVIGSALEIHAEATAARGSRDDYPLAIAETDPRRSYREWPFARLKEHDRDLFWKTLVGLNYTFGGGWNVVLEYYRDRSGLKPFEAQRFDDYIAYNEIHSQSVLLAARNLAWTVGGIGLFARRQRYMFVRVTRSRIARRWDLEWMAVIDADDGSSVWIPQASYRVTDRVSAYARFHHLAGSRTTEYGSLPVRSSGLLGLALHF